MVWNVFNFHWGTLQTFQNALRMFLNAFQRFEMRSAEKRLNANFVKSVFPKDGHIFTAVSESFLFSLIVILSNHLFEVQE